MLRVARHPAVASAMLGLAVTSSVVAADELPPGMALIDAPFEFLASARLTADGETLVGQTIFEQTGRAAIWTRESGLSILPSLSVPWPSGELAGGRAADGTILGVHQRQKNGAIDTRLLAWSGGGVAVLPQSELPIIETRIAATSSDGHTIVGWGLESLTLEAAAWRWTAATGPAPLLPLPGDPGAEAVPRAADADAATVVGLSSNRKTQRPVAWLRGSDSPTDLGSLTPDAAYGDALDVTPDGEIIVGVTADADLVERAFRWTAATGMTEVPGMNFALRIADDGSWIFGVDLEAGSVFWTAETQTIEAEEWLLRRGFQLPDEWIRDGGWSVRRVGGDGRTIIIRRGLPGSPTSWYLQRLPSACPADLDASGDVANGDLLEVLQNWDGPDGDIDGDGTTGFGDLAAVLGAWGPCS